MTFGQIFFTGAAAVAMGLIAGEILGFMVGDAKRQRRRDLSMGAMGALIGWIFSFFLPIPQQYFVPAALSMSAHSTGICLFVYFLVFHRRSRLAEEIDANYPLNNEPRDEPLAEEDVHRPQGPVPPIRPRSV
jgi:hypothetical protein